jgi:hypothetical protein
MRKHLGIFLLFFLFATPAVAQRTLVTGTITDPNGLPWAGGSIQATLSLPVGVSGATLNGVQISGTTQRTALDATGSFTMQLPDNAIVQPPGTQWTFAVSISPGVLPPIGFGPVSFSLTLTITGASQNVSAALSAASPPLSRPIGSSPGFASITSGTNTTAAMIVGSGASLAPSGAGSIQATNITNGVGAPVNPCTNGALYTDNGTGNTYSCNSLSWSIIGSQSSFNPNLINPSLLGVVSDVKIFYSDGSTIGVTGGSSVVTCNNCGFTNADVGKNLEATTGCCGGTGMFGGLLAMAVTPITSVTNGTTVSVAPATAIQNCTPNCTLGYGHNDDTGWTAVDNAVNTANFCSVIPFPAGYSFVKEPHWNPTAGSVCNNSSIAHDLNYRFSGFGEYVSQIVIQSDFDWPACLFGSISNACFFTYAQETVDHLGMTGLGYGNTGNHAKRIVHPGFGSRVDNFMVFGFAGADGSAVGITLSSAFSGNLVTCDGFGNICGESKQTGFPVNNLCSFCFFGDNLGTNFLITDENYVDFSSFYGVSSSIANIRNNGATYLSYGSGPCCGTGAQTATGGASLYAVAGTTFLHGGTWDNSVSTNGCGMNVQGGTVYSIGTAFKGSGTCFGIFKSTGNYFDLGGNTYTGGTSGITPTCTFSTGGGTTPACTTLAGSTNEKGTIIATTGTGAPGSTGTITLTFSGTFAGGTGATPACVYTLDNSATAWGNEAVVFASTQSTTAPVVAWSNVATAVLTALATSSPYRISYTCTPR